MAVPTFTSAETGAAERGRAFGRAGRVEIRGSFRGYSDLFAAVGASEARVRAWGGQALARTEEWAPRLAEEIGGIAAGAGLEPWQVGALNARTEILAAAGVTGEGECSTAVLLPGGGQPPRTMQTWDWNDSLRDGRVVWALEPRPGHTVRCFTEFGVLGKVGVNSAGLGLHFNILRHASDHERIGVPVHVVARQILDEAASIDDAVRIARSARVSASTVITVVAFDGERGAVRGLELCPDGVAELPAGPDGVLLHTNHFLDQGLARGERLTPAESTTYQRLEKLRERVADLGAATPIGRARAMLGHETGAALCCHADPSTPVHQRRATLLTIGLDMVRRRLEFHEGGPCQVQAATWQTF